MSLRYTNGWVSDAPSRAHAEGRAIDTLAERLAARGWRPRELVALRIKKKSSEGYGVLADVICDEVKRDAVAIAAELRRLQLVKRGEAAPAPAGEGAA